MKRSAIALAALATFTPAQADEKSCDNIVKAYQWDVFTVTQRADTVNNKYCVSMSSKDERVKGVVMATSDGKSGFTLLSDEGCIDVKGDPRQAMQPVVLLANDSILKLAPLSQEEAVAAFKILADSCTVGDAKPETPGNFIAPPSDNKLGI